MSERQPYSRVYWSIRTDAKFDEIYGDDHHLAAWLRLLIAADATWPAPADVPASARKSSLRALADAQLIDLLPSGMFKVRGLDAERGRRRDAAQTSAGFRQAPGPNADRTVTERSANGLLAKPSQAEDETRTSRDAPSYAGAPDPADVYWTLTGRYPTDKVLGWVDDLSASYGTDAVIRALATTHGQDASASSLLGRTQDVLRAEARALTLKEQSQVRANLKERRSTQPVRDEAAIRAEIRRLMQPGAAA